MREFADKIAVVTGGSSGLGECVVKKFLNEGAKVAILDVDIDGGNPNH